MSQDNRFSSSSMRHRHDINGIVFMALALFLAFAYYFDAGTTGILGQLFLGMGKGLFGAAAYALPAIFLYMSIDYFVEKKNDRASRRIKHILILLILASTFIQVFGFTYDDFKLTTMTNQNEYSAFQAISVLWSGSIEPQDVPLLNGRACGGLLGGLLGLGLQRVLGQIGTVILLVFAVLIEMVLVINLSLSAFLSRFVDQAKNVSGQVNQRVKQSIENRRINQSYVDDEDYLEEPVVQNYKNNSTAQAYPEIGGASNHDDFNDLDLSMPSGIPDGTSGFINFSDVEEGGAVHLNPEDMGLLSKYPEWDATSAFKEKPETEGFVGIPIASYDAGKAKEPLDLMSELGNSMPPSNQSFHIPEFLNTRVDRPNLSESLEAELHEVLQESYDDEEAYYKPELDTDLAEKVGSIRKFDGIDREKFRDPHAARQTPHVAGRSDDAGKADAAFAPPTSHQTDLDADVKKYVPIKKDKPYKLPPITLLQPGMTTDTRRQAQEVQALGKKLEDTLKSFGVEAKVINITTGPAITRFELTPGLGVKVSKIVSLADDIALSLAAVGVRIEAPIPGKSAIGIEIPNKETAPVSLRGLIESAEFKNAKSKLTVALGRDIPGAPILCDLTKMPHLLIAGATGSGKSVCINSILISILYRAKPDEVKLLMIDPKVVELSVYNGIPHLLAPVVTDPKKAANTLNWAVLEMTRRYALFAEKGVRDLSGYNESLEMEGEPRVPLILVVIDELSDLMMTAPNEVEDSIARLTAMARAAGIHLIIATQRPSVDVITGVIKANIPSRIAFAVSSQVDSRTIIDIGGAEKLLGKGDMLYFPQSLPKPKRGQGAFLSDHEVEKVISFITAQEISGFDGAAAETIMTATSNTKSSGKDNAQEDELFDQAVEVLLDAGYASVSILQRRMNIGYPRAARLIDAMELAGIIGPHEGAKPRKLLINRIQWETRKNLDEK